VVQQPRRHPWLKRTALLGTSLLLGLLLAELAIRLCVPARNVGPSFVVYDRDYRRRLKKSASFTSVSEEFSFRITTNSLGYRDPEWSPPPTGVVLFLGDSFTMGYGVNDGEEFPRLIEAALADRREHERLPVFNAAIGNAGNAHWIKFLRREAPRLAPRTVVFQVCSNDFRDNRRERLFTLSSSGTLEEHAAAPPGWIWKAQRIAEAVPGVSYSHLVSLIKLAALRATRSPGAARSANTTTPAAERARTEKYLREERLTFALIREGVDICKEKDWPVILLNVGLEGARRDQLRQLCDELQVPLLDTPTKKQRPDLYYKVDGHWNSLGHQHVAELLLPHVLASCPLGVTK
jgi:lysophospholipase L1-like esterase